MEDQKTFKTPGKTLARIQTVHLGKILFNLQFIALSIMIASVLSFIAYPIYYVLLVGITIITLFTIFAYYPGFSSWWNPNILNKVSMFLAGSWKYTIPVVLVLSLLSILCLSFDKNRKHIGRIVACVVICVLAIIFLVFKAAMQ